EIFLSNHRSIFLRPSFGTFEVIKMGNIVHFPMSWSSCKPTMTVYLACYVVKKKSKYSSIHLSALISMGQWSNLKDKLPQQRLPWLDLALLLSTISCQETISAWISIMQRHLSLSAWETILKRHKS